VRIFKSRTQATDACKTGKVKVNDNSAKPSQSVEIGDHIAVRKNGFNLQFKVVDLIKKRVGAPLPSPATKTLLRRKKRTNTTNGSWAKARSKTARKVPADPPKKIAAASMISKTTGFN